MKKAKITIYKGSSRGLNDYLNQNKITPRSSFTAMVVTMDKERKSVATKRTRYNQIVIRERDYYAITKDANNTLVTIIEELLVDDGRLVLQNPQRYIEEELLLQYPRQTEVVEEQVTTLGERHIMNVIRNNQIFTEWKMELLKTLLYFSQHQSDKPYVILLYGGSGLGKTHIVKELVKEMEEELISFQLSNFQDTATVGILLGERFPSKDIYSQIKLSSNSLVLLDEFDKLHKFGYNAFYDIFDEPIAGSDYVTVNLRNRIFIATSNFGSMDDIESHLPNPIVNRINKYIYVPDLTDVEINKYINSKNLSEEMKRRVMQEILVMPQVNLRIIDNCIEDLKIEQHWDKFVQSIKSDVEGE